MYVHQVTYKINIKWVIYVENNIYVHRHSKYKYIVFYFLSIH